MFLLLLFYSLLKDFFILDCENKRSLDIKRDYSLIGRPADRGQPRGRNGLTIHYNYY